MAVPSDGEEGDGGSSSHWRDEDAIKVALADADYASQAVSQPLLRKE